MEQTGPAPNTPQTGRADARETEHERALTQAEAGLRQRFGRTGDVRLAFSPYRICPLGAHVDHQDGVVTGMAIDQGVALAFGGREDGQVRAASANFSGDVSFALEAIPPATPGDWGNFLRGAVVALRQAGHTVSHGLDLFVAGQLPVGGLSSSAAVGVGYLLALEAVNGLEIAPEENIALARAIENQYIGLRSGVLDQSMILLSHAGTLLRLDCRTGERAYIRFGEGGAAASGPGERAASHFTGQGTSTVDPNSVSGRVGIAVAYSGLSESQGLVGTGYNQRVAECHAAARQLLELAGMGLPEGGARLRDVPVTVYEHWCARLLPELARRAAHYFGEQARVEAGTVAWARGEIAPFGRLVTESGRSSIENYECGAPELVALYEALIATPGVYGARFSGAGFRGSCLALVDPAQFDAIAERVRSEYLGAYPQYAATFGFFHCAAGKGAHLL